MNESYTQINESNLIRYDFDETGELLQYLNDPSSFRSFSQGLSELLDKAGYSGPNTPEAKYDYLCQKLQDISVTIPSLKEWFFHEEKHPSIEQKTRRQMYEICFALNLSLDNTRWFFSHVYYDRSFNCHCLEEAVYYFCFSKGLSYAEAKEIIRAVEKQEAPSSPFNDDYTHVIIDHLNSFATKEELITYLIQNKATFEEGHWNQCALQLIKDLRAEILGNEDQTNSTINALRKHQHNLEDKFKKCGLLLQELYYSYKKDHPQSPEEFLCDYLKGAQPTTDSFMLAHIFNPIAREDVNSQDSPDKKEAAKKRKENFAKNLPELVRKHFPDKHAFSNILNKGESSKFYDSIRKTLILLAFYSFWCRTKLNSSDPDHLPQDFEYETNQLLETCGYEALTACNPYDWLYLIASRHEDPLDEFRDFIHNIIEEDFD